MPVKTPVSVPRSEVGSIPAFSNASQAASSMSRCCGSMASASRGLIPKKSASKSATPSTKPPALVVTVPCRSGSAPRSRSRSQPRSLGSGDIASRPAATSSHSSSGELTPPG